MNDDAVIPAILILFVIFMFVLGAIFGFDPASVFIWAIMILGPFLLIAFVCVLVQGLIEKFRE